MGKKKQKKVLTLASPLHRIFVDYENAPDCLPLIEEYDHDEVWIFVGRQQKKIPLELVQRMQGLGRAVHWVAPGAVGKNALDFILAMHVGIHHATTDLGVVFAIFSADRGYDPLIGELARDGRKVVRVNPERETPTRRRKTKKKKSAAATSTSSANKKKKREKSSSRVTVADLAARVADRLARTTKDRLPTREKTLLKHVESQLPATQKDRASSVVQSLKRRKIISVDRRSGTVTYRGGEG
jgi:hypothetical protein